MRFNIIEVNQNSKFYPERLRNIYSPPKQLFCFGNLSLLNFENNIAVIGSRDYSFYGKRVADDFSFNLAKNDFCIISGLARGIDSFAHMAALDAKGRTIAVLGSGLDNIYPKENMKLAKRIVENGGLIISEYELGTRPLKQHLLTLQYQPPKAFPEVYPV